MNWFVQYRMDWIAQMLKVYGYINRRHLVRQFGISLQQAANDFNAFNEMYPGKMLYDNRRKTYVAAVPPEGR